MKKLLRCAFKLLLLVLFPGMLLAQSNPDFTVLLNSGKFLPPANAQTLNQDAAVFRHSLFQGQHYVTIQFKALPTETEKTKLKAAGILLQDYLPNLAYTAVINQNASLEALKSAGARSIFQLTAEQKTVPALLRKDFPAHAIKQKGTVELTLITYEKLDKKTVGLALQKLKATVVEEQSMFRSFTVRVPQANAARVVALPFVQWVEFIDAPNVAENLLGRTLHRVNALNDGVRNLKGDSINVGIWDGGEVSPHLDFSPASRLQMIETSQAESHSTHVAGTIAGRGIINPKARGMAPNAKLYSYNFNGNIQTEMATAIPLYNLAISSHSYGSTQTCGITGAGVAYSSTSRSTDLNLNTNPSHLHVHSAGNSQSACTGGWSTITGSGKTAKNNILVANITTTDGISNSSSFGPVHDGRVKPEISAFGTNVLSTYTPLNTYGTITGTSMATPGVSGTVALLVQRYKQMHGGVSPISSLIKAVTCNTAQDLGNPGPDYKFGFGRLNGLNAVRALEQNRYAVNTVSTGATNDVTISVPANTARIKVMLTWNDPAGTANASVALVNNLDLSVISGTTTTLPWKLDGNNPGSNATRGVDNVSNVEQVTLDNPPAGTYTLRVAGTAVPSGANQQYSLTWEIDQPYIEVIYPNGAESLSPGSQETITWNNAGVTANQTIQYSLDNGATWSAVASNVLPNVTRYNWTLPSTANTATALVRVFSGSISDVSDATFKILGTPTTLNATPGLCGGTLNFTWPAVTNATNYDLYKLDDVTGQFVIMASNVAGTTYAASGLTPNASMWFTIVAKNNLTGASSERALAINKTIPASSSSIVLGSISGPATLCGSSQTVTYSVQPNSTVTNYNWTVPAGATLVSGQGSNAISVSFNGNLTGNISVTGTTGSCQTAPETLTVSVNSTIAPPVSAGNKTDCYNYNQSGPVTVLTPSATVPAGFTVVWYTAATGGSVINNPELRTVGTATYYAASRSQSGTCESQVRTPVTLTINTAPMGQITASGSTTICEGDSVILTAPAGSAYLWNHGATTRSVAATLSGGYTVTVWQANGCSAPGGGTVITVIRKPTVKLEVEPTTEIAPGTATTLKAKGEFGNSPKFTWTKNGTVLPNETGATLRVAGPQMGEYAVEVSNSNNCSVVSNKITLTSKETTGAFIYPNPNNGRFQVRFYTKPGVKAISNIQVYDSRGALLHEQQNTVQESYQRIDVDLGQRKGFFWVILRDAEGKEIASSKIVLQ